MDKVAKLRKQKRRYAKLQEQKAENAMLMQSYNESCKRNKVKSNVRIRELKKANRMLQSMISCEMNLTCQVAMLTYLRRRYHWGQTRLFRYSCRAVKWTANAYDEDHNALRMLDELKSDYDCDVVAEWERNIPEPTGMAHEKEKQSIMYEFMPPIMAIHIYAIKSLGFGKKRLSRLLPEVCDLVRLMISRNNLSQYREELNRNGFLIDKEGHFWSKGIPEGKLDFELRELQKYVKVGKECKC